MGRSFHPSAAERIYKTNFSFKTNAVDPGIPANTVHSFDRLSDALREVADARVYTGFHYRFATRQGAIQDRNLGNWILKNFLGPRR